jgi:hypothetical protein
VAKGDEEARRGLVVLAALGLAGFAFSTERQAMDDSRLIQGGFQFNYLGKGFTQPITLAAHDILFFFSEHREGKPLGFTCARIHSADASREIWVTEHPSIFRQRFGPQFAQLHFPVIETSPGELPPPDPDGHDPSMEVRPLWVNRDAVQFIGPSGIISVRRGRTGKVHFRDGGAQQLYELVPTLEQIFKLRLDAGKIQRIETTWRPQ